MAAAFPAGESPAAVALPEAFAAGAGAGVPAVTAGAGPAAALGLGRDPAASVPASAASGQDRSSFTTHPGMAAAQTAAETAMAGRTAAAGRHF